MRKFLNTDIQRNTSYKPSIFYSLKTQRTTYCLVVFIISFLMSACGILPPVIRTPTPTLSPTVSHISTETSNTPSVSVSTPARSPNPSPTLPPTKEPTATEIPPTHTPTASQTPEEAIAQDPKYSSDLLFLSENQLMRWDYVTDFVVPITDKVLDYSVTTNGRTGALMRSMNVAANGEQLFELSILDFETMQIKPLLEGISRLYNLSISPDGGWVAYYSQKNGGRLHVIRTDGSNETREVGFCHRPLDQSCEPVSWSPDSLKFLWSDERGIWFTQLDWSKPDLITLNKIEIVDPEGEKSTISVDFNSLIWSPSGRYALTEVIPSASIASWYVLIDTRRQRLVEIPNSFQEEVSTTNVSWLLDGSLIVGYSDPDILEPALSIDNYEVVPTREDLLLYKDTYILYSEDFPETAAQIEEQNIFLLDWPYHQSTQLLCLGVSTIDSITSPVVFSYDFEMKLLTKVNEVPPNTVDVLWSPDASGALVINSRNQVYFTSMNGGELHYLSPIIGEEAEQFTWLPPTPRS